jgi:hypothetical protein
MSLSTTQLGTYDLDLGEMDFRECGDCGVVWGMTVGFTANRRRDHRTWYCPNGHPWIYPGESDLEKARRELRQAKDRLAVRSAELDQTQASLRATKGVVTRQRKKLEKVVAGVCPVDGCKRHFRDLRRHIETKHPTYEGGA